MWKQSSRKRLDTRTTGSFTDLLTRQTDGPADDMARRALGCVAPVAEGAPAAAYFSAANYLAHNPATDSHVMQADSKHLFAAVFTARTTSRGGHYLRQHLHSELMAQSKANGGDVAKALQASVQHLNKAFKNLHPFNPAVLDGVQVAVAHLDFASRQLVVASNGGCRCVVGRSTREGHVDVIASVGLQRQQEPRPDDEVELQDVCKVRLSHAADTIILGSVGLWRELAPAKGLLRVHHFYESAPKASNGSAAAHLANFALHGVTQRLRASADPRMRSLSSVASLTSLHAGERTQFKWGTRQPVRRRRGDVHGDLTAVVFRLDWEGKQCSFKEQSKKVRQESTAPAQRPPRQYSHWDLVRMHFLEFPRQSRELARQAWRETAAAATEHAATLPAAGGNGPRLALKAVDSQTGETRNVSVNLRARAGADARP